MLWPNFYHRDEPWPYIGAIKSWALFLKLCPWELQEWDKSALFIRQGERWAAKHEESACRSTNRREKREKERKAPSSPAVAWKGLWWRGRLGLGVGAEQGWGMALRRIRGLRDILGIGNSSGVRGKDWETVEVMGEQHDWSKAWPREGEHGVEGYGAVRKIRMEIPSERGESQGKSGLEHQCQTNKQDWNWLFWRSWGIKAVSSA